MNSVDKQTESEDAVDTREEIHPSKRPRKLEDDDDTNKINNPSDTITSTHERKSSGHREEIRPSKRPRKLEDDDDSNNINNRSDAVTGTHEQKSSGHHASVVAAHYNQIEEKGIKERYNSPIFNLRNFNNWVKSVLIIEYTDKIREKDYGRPITVLDICCGKGGDLSKWRRARVEHVVFADIAEVSVQQCKTRYDEMTKNCQRTFKAQFITADCTRNKLRDKYADPSINFDLVSCQFGLHYSFESYAQARKMLTNISECLRPGGYFFGTIPNAYEIVSRAKKSKDNEFGNRIYNIKLLFDPEEGYDLFGAKYDFSLDEVVNCPEFLVNFQLLVKLAAEFGLELVYSAGFSDFYNNFKTQHKQLLNRTTVFESYPPPPDKSLIGPPSEYEHAAKFLETLDTKNGNNCIGTLSQSEWDVATVYMAFAFKKCKHSWDANGKPVYELSSKATTSSTASNK